MFFIIIIAIAVISFLLSVFALIGENDKREVNNAKKKILKDKIIFQTSSSSK